MGGSSTAWAGHEGDCPSPTRTPALTQSPGPFPTPLTSLQPTPSPGKPSELPQPSRAIPRTLGIGAATSVSHLCFPTAPVPAPECGRGPPSSEGAAYPARLSAPAPSPLPQHCLSRAWTDRRKPWYTLLSPAPGALAHLRGGAPLLIRLWAWSVSCPACCRYMDGK